MIVLATWLWQGIAIVCVTALLLSLARNAAAATRHAIWWVALAAVVLLPFVPALQRSLSWQPGILSPQALPAEAAVPLPAAPDEFLVALAGAWALFTFLSFVRIAFSVCAVRRLKARSAPFDSARLARLSMWNALDEGRRVPVLRVSPKVRAASALGLGRPVILISPAVLALDDDGLDAIVMHEHAHLARYDDWTQLAQAVVSALLVLHPAAWFIGRRIRLEREAACDDYVVARGAAAREYARSLIELADPARVQPWKSVAIPGATRSRSELRQRVHRLLDPSRPRDARLAWPLFAACAATMALAVGAAAQAPALVVFVESYVPAPPVGTVGRAAAFAAHSVSVAIEAPVVNPPVQLVSQTAAGPVTVLTAVETQVSPLAPATSLPPVSTVAMPLVPVPVSLRVGPGDLDMATMPPAPASPAGEISKSPPPAAEPWMTIARSVASASKATGGGAKTAGTSIGRFFGRTGKALAGGL
jgi:beta-lactamase regulating signal transducer with metallopeptidase domain